MPLVPADRTQPRRALRGIVAALAAGLLALPLGLSGVVAPARAEDGIEIDSVVVRSEKAEAWSTIAMEAQWHADSPAADQTFTISLGDGLRWPAALNFPLLDKDAPTVSVGDCVVSSGSAVMTCTLNSLVEQWDSVTGTLSATAQITDELIGLSESTIVVGGAPVTVVPGDANGDGICDAGCDGVSPQPASPSTYKMGWLSAVGADGSYTWSWDVNVHGSTEYSVLDEGATLNDVRCTDSNWSESWGVTPETDTAGALTWKVDSAETVCRLRFTSTSRQSTVSNSATVNGTVYEASAEAWELGSGEVAGTAAPSPEPSATSTETSTTSSTAQKTADSAGTGVAPSVPVTVVGPASPTADAPAGGGSPLARTGGLAGMAALVGVVVLAAGGAGLFIVRRRA